MSSIIEGYNYDIFISYRQKDNKGDRWVSEFVEALKAELESTFKEEISVYFDINSHDGLLETHDVDGSLKEKLKCLIFIPIISRTYCDLKSFAWEHEFKAFVELASKDQFGLKVKIPNGNVANRVLPVRIHELDNDDIKLCESILGGVLRGVEFIYKEQGVNRPLRSTEESPGNNLNKTFYRNQINKVALAIKEIIIGSRAQPFISFKEINQSNGLHQKADQKEKQLENKKPAKLNTQILLSGVLIIVILIVAAIFAYPKVFERDRLENLRSKGKISVAVMPFQNMTNDTIWDVWQDGIQGMLITSLSNNPNELSIRQIESITSLLQNRGYTNYASITPSVARKLSKKLDANIFINGSINQAGSTIRLNVQLVDSQTDVVLKSFQIDGIPENILATIDSLSIQVRNFLLISELERGVTADFHSYGSTTSPEAYRDFICGQNAHNRKDYLTAISFFEQALDIDSNFIFPSFILVWDYYYIGKTDQAKEIALQYYLKRDKISLPYAKLFIDYNYAVFFETPSEAIRSTRQMVQIDDQNPWNHFLLGVSYTELEQYDKAIPEYKAALEIYERWDVKPGWINNYLKLGHAYHKTGQFRKEKKLYTTAERVFPNDPALIYRQAILALSEGDTKMVNKYIEKYKSLRKGNSESESVIAAGQAEIYSEADIPDIAEEYYREARALDYNGSWSQNNLAYFLIDKDRNVNEGLEIIANVLKLSPDDYNCLHTKGWGLYKQGRYQEALETLQKSWDIRRELATYDHKAFLHLEAAKKAVASQKNN